MVERRTTREARLAALVRELAADARTPYPALFRHAGCDAEEAARLASREGAEATLARLLAAGVYLTHAELRGRAPVRRGALELAVGPDALVAPRAAVHGRGESSGSTGARFSVPIGLPFVADHAVDTLLALAAYGGLGWRHAFYGVPGATALTHPLEMAKAGRPLARAFVSVPLGAPGVDLRYRLGLRAMVAAGRLAGVRLPRFEPAALADPEPLARWMAAELAAGEVPHLWTYASSAVRVIEAARARGLDLAGARFTCGGEPTTAARRAAIEAAGAVALPRLGATETDILAYACARPGAPDEMHFLDDRHALVQPGDSAPAGLPSRALLLTSLLPSAPLRLLNVCLGDQAEVGAGECGCTLEAAGWRLRLREVRSFEKTTVAGTTLEDLDLVPILEQLLPARFGGGPTDYQLAERLDGGRVATELALRIEPGLGPLDEVAVVESVLAALDVGSPARRMLAWQWRESRSLRVVREPPRRTATGKIAHLHREPAEASGRDQSSTRSGS